MTVDEIFSALSAHQIEGMMLHDELADYYDFLSLRGAKRCHEYHYFCESIAYRRLRRYYLNHYNRLIPAREVAAPELIPASWYRYERQDVDAGTKQSAVKNGVERWVAWERETKALYQGACKELFGLGEIAAARFVGCMVEDVDCELKRAERRQLALSAMGYDLTMIAAEQDAEHERYKDKTEKLVIEV